MDRSLIFLTVVSNFDHEYFVCVSSRRVDTKTPPSTDRNGFCRNTHPEHKQLKNCVHISNHDDINDRNDIDATKR